MLAEQGVERALFLEIDRAADIAQVASVRVVQRVGHRHDQAPGGCDVGLADGGLLAGQRGAGARAVDRTAFGVAVARSAGQQFALGADDIHRVEGVGLQEETVGLVIELFGRIRPLADHRGAVGELLVCRFEEVLRDLRQFHRIDAIGL
ncbi:hypothetical protein D3C77_471280 [compost metagenome]